jgi:hypothetical protein
MVVFQPWAMRAGGVCDATSVVTAGAASTSLRTTSVSSLTWGTSTLPRPSSAAGVSAGDEDGTGTASEATAAVGEASDVGLGHVQLQVAGVGPAAEMLERGARGGLKLWRKLNALRWKPQEQALPECGKEDAVRHDGDAFLSVASRLVQQWQEILVEEGISAPCHGVLRLHIHKARRAFALQAVMLLARHLRLGRPFEEFLPLHRPKVLLDKQRQLHHFRHSSR